MIALDLSNKFMMTSATTHLALLPRPSTILTGEQIYMSDLDTDKGPFEITPEDKFQDE